MTAVTRAAGRPRFPAEVAISAGDIAWFRTCRSLWVDSESGAPAIFGPSLSPENIGTISSGDYTANATRLEPVLCAFFLHATFEPGRYRVVQPLHGDDGVEVTQDDVTLLRHTSWRTFAIDSKRPYGDFTNYPIEMARALGLPVTKNVIEGFDEVSPEIDARMVELHRKSEHVLQAYIAHARLVPGTWFIPEDGWDMLISPRCRPVKEAATSAYRRAMAAIALRANVESPVDLAVRRIRASAELFLSE